MNGAQLELYSEQSLRVGRTHLAFGQRTGVVSPLYLSIVPGDPSAVPVAMRPPTITECPYRSQRRRRIRLSTPNACDLWGLVPIGFERARRADLAAIPLGTEPRLAFVGWAVWGGSMAAQFAARVRYRMHWIR